MSDRPNILFITSDQQHFSTLGCVNPLIHTPALDGLAAQGLRFDRAYTVNPTCTPTRATWLTGQYPSQHGAWTLGAKLPDDAMTLPRLFNQGGYDTSLIGKAHFQPLVSTPEFPSMEAYPLLQDLAYWRGFNDDPTRDFYGFSHVELARNHTAEAHVGQHYALWLEEKGLKNWRDYFYPPTGRLDPATRYRWDIPEEYHYDAWIAERVNARMERCVKRGQPFFCWASFFDPHPPYLAPAPWDAMYDGLVTPPQMTPHEHDHNPPHFAMTQNPDADWSAYRESGYALHGMGAYHCRVTPEEAKKNMSVYYGMVSLMDKYIGKILERLDALGQTDNTLVVFTTDHGHFFGQHGLHYKGPFMYEDAIRVPLLARMPGRIQPGVSCQMESLADIAPTFLTACGLPVPRLMTGRSAWAEWTGQGPACRSHIICEHHHEPTTVNLRTYVDQRYKLTVYMNHSYGEMYDLQSDPGEIHNLWDDPACASLKQELLLRYISAELEKEPMWMPRIANA